MGLGGHGHGQRMVQPVFYLVYRADHWGQKQSRAVDFLDSNFGCCRIRVCMAGVSRWRSSSTSSAQVGRLGVRGVGSGRRGAVRFSTVVRSCRAITARHSHCAVEHGSSKRQRSAQRDGACNYLRGACRGFIFNQQSRLNHNARIRSPMGWSTIFQRGRRTICVRNNIPN